MKTAFLSEMGIRGKISKTHENMRTEFAWMCESNADHHNIFEYGSVRGYDQVFVIIPKGEFTLNVVGCKISNPASDRVSLLLSQLFVQTLRDNNTAVYIVQEGPSWMFNDWEVADQFNWYGNVLASSGIMCHNSTDVPFYRGLFPDKFVGVLPTAMIDHHIKDIVWTPEDKVLIGGNFSRWYGGFQSYIVAQEFGVEKWTQTSHSTRDGETLIEDLNHLPRMSWLDWMKNVATFKYAVHLMPTAAAGTFNLNCAYFGIPCIGNIKVDTQRICYPDLSVDVEDVNRARKLARMLVEDKAFYSYCSDYAKSQVEQFVTSGDSTKIPVEMYDKALNNE